MSFIPVFGHLFVLGDDIMTIWFWPAMTRRAVIDIWQDKNTVWRSVLRESTVVWSTIYREVPLIVRIVKVILKMTVVLSVSMVIFSSIKFMIQIFNGSEIKSAGAIKDLKNILIWLLIAMFSITAVNLIISLPKNSLQTQNTYLNTSWKVFYV